MKKIFAMLAAVSAMSLAACSVNSNKGECADSAECKDKAACCDKATGECKDKAECKDAAKQGGGAAPVNTKCPVSGEALPADAKTVSFNGQSVGLCCPGCEGKFEAMGADAKSAALAKAK